MQNVDSYSYACEEKYDITQLGNRLNNLTIIKLMMFNSYILVIIVNRLR